MLLEVDNSCPSAKKEKKRDGWGLSFMTNDTSPVRIPFILPFIFWKTIAIPPFSSRNQIVIFLKQQQQNKSNNIKRKEVET